MLAPSTLATIDGYWAAELGVPAELLRRPGIHLMAHSGGMANYQGAYLLRRAVSVVFTVPGRLAGWPRLRGALQARAPATLFDPAFLSDLFGPATDRIIGPAYQGFVDGATYRPVDGRGARLLTSDDIPALARLRAACDETEWAHSAIVPERGDAVFVCFAADDVAAAGTLERRREPIASVGIITHPAYRGQGYGRAVVGAMTAHALDNGLTPRYQTLLANVPSIAIARSLGYSEYAQTIAVRLHDAQPHEYTALTAT